MSLTRETIIKQADAASVSIAMRPPYMRPSETKPLPPRLWEDLRLEMQKRLREATGEEFAIVSFDFGPAE